MKTIILLLVTSFTANLCAQDNRFGKVSKEELEKERSLIDPETPTEILYEKIYINIEFSQQNGQFIVNKEVEGRIKIYDKNNTSEQYLKKEVVIYTPNSTREKISGFKGVTYNLENGKITETKVSGSDVFHEEKNKYWDSEKFAYENVRDGSVLEYKYTVQSPFYREVDRWFFQQDIPVVYSELDIRRPDFMVYSPDERGEVRGQITSEKIKDPNYDFNNVTTKYIYKNVKALRDEPFVFNPNNLKASVRFELMKLEHPRIITENYATSWPQIGKDLNNHENLGKQLSGNNFLDETVQQITGNLSTPLEKTQAIFDYVKNNFTWNRFQSIYADSGVRQTFKNKTGNAADINLLLVSILQKAGVDASPVVLSTVDNLIINYTFPSVTGLNFLIASAEIGNTTYLMDATEKMSKINMLPLRDLNHRGFVIKNTGTIKEISLTNYVLSNIKTVIGVQLDTDGTITGNYTETKDEYFAMSDNMSRKDDPKDFEKEYLSDFDFDINNFRVDENQETGMVRYSFKFDHIPGGEVLGDKILINPLLFTQHTKSNFVNDNRSYPLEFGSLISKSSTVKIKIPEGYKVQSVPEEKKFVVEGETAGYLYKVEEKEGFIILSTIYQIGQSILPSTFYKPMKEFEKQQINTENQQVVLVKL